MTKTQKVVEQLVAGNGPEAVKLANGFKMGFTKEEKDTITRAHEMTWNATFYEMLGYSAEKEMEQAVAILNEKLI